MKKINKILSIFLAVALIFSASSVTASAYAAGVGTENSPYQITTAQELQDINNDVTAHYILMADIDLTGMDFTPIGNADSGAFSGSFDGNGYTVSNLDVFTGKYAGLFGCNEGTVKNVTLSNIYVYGTRYVGGVVGENTSIGVIENCCVLSGNVESDGGLNDVNIGGICGYNSGKIAGVNSNGANISANTSDVNAYAGGLVGYSSADLVFENCYNTGEVSYYGSSFSSNYVDVYFGGLVGRCNSTCTIENSYNTGNISSSSSADCYPYFGGFVGSGTVTINNSYNTGNVSSSSSVSSYSGGFVGVGFLTINNSYNTGNVSSRTPISDAYSGGFLGYTGSTINICNSYNTGNIYSSGGDNNYNLSYSGGLAGGAWGGGIISNSYNTGNIDSDDGSGGLVGYVYTSAWVRNPLTIVNSYTETSVKILGAPEYSGEKLFPDDMKKQSTYYGWDFDEVWTIDSNINNGYPVLKTTASPLNLNFSHKIINSGSTLQLIAYKNGVATSDVKWSVSDGSSTVTSKGLVTAGGIGFTTITATDSDGNKANFNAYVISPATSLTAVDRTINLSEGTVFNDSYYTLSGGSGDFVSCESSDTSVVKVDSDGILTPVSAGTAIITIKSAGGLSATQKITVTDVATGISLPSTLTVARGSTKKITATTYPNPTSSVVTWKSSDTSVATVDNEGNVTGLKIGSTTITATTDNGYSSNCTVTVNAPLTEMAFETPSLTLYVGQEYKLKLNIHPTDTTETITYSSSSTSKATVSSAGTVTAGTSTGTVTVTATSSSGKKAYCNITIKAWPSVLTVVDSDTTISQDVITTDTTGVRNLEKLLTVKDGYNIDVTYSHQINGLNYCGTGTTINVYDDYGNLVITYTLVVNGDVNGDSFVDVLDATLTERMSTDAITYDEPQAYAANGTAIETVDTSSYQYVLNKALAE